MEPGPPRWNRSRWLAVARETIRPEETPNNQALALGKAFDTWYWLLPPWPYPNRNAKAPSLPEAPTFAVKTVPLDRLQGTVWLFDPPHTWPRTLDHWVRVGSLLLLAYTSAAGQARWNAGVVDKWPPLELLDNGDGTFWMDDGCRRAYTAWLIGANTVRSLVLTHATRPEASSRGGPSYNV